MPGRHPMGSAVSGERERPALELKVRLGTVSVGAWLKSHFREVTLRAQQLQSWGRTGGGRLEAIPVRWLLQQSMT